MGFSMESQNARLGLILFVIYTLFYCGFVFLNAFAADSMEWLPFAGINLAIWYGFGLIILAFVMSIVYGLMCRESKE